MTCNHERCRFTLFQHFLCALLAVALMFNSCGDRDQDARLDALESARDEEGQR
jgi:hypothetical protein